jgi:hypothetical protein
VPASLTRETLYFRWDADHDVSTKTVQFSVDDGAHWLVGTFVPTVNLPAEVANENNNPDNQPDKGMTGYWFKVLLGAGVANGVLAVGDNVITGQLLDGVNPTDEQVVRTWAVIIGA